MQVPTHPALDRARLVQHPLADRVNRVHVPADAVAEDAPPPPLPPAAVAFIDETAERIRAAHRAGRPVILAFGAHAIKNGLGPVLGALLRDGWLTHLATNGAGIIHDWELAYQGATSEDVRANVAEGRFGIWQETGFHLNLALLVGAWAGLGYGASIGAMIADGGLDLPDARHLLAESAPGASDDLDHAAAALDLLGAMRRFDLHPGRLPVPHPFSRYSVQAMARHLGVPFTGHPMFGHDILYTHPLNCGAAVGRTAERDFLSFAAAIRRLQDGVYLSVGSAVMSPMVFEKALSMARNLAAREGQGIDRFFLGVVDLAPATWDWARDGEPPPENPAYYLRYLKSFSRMGGTMRYASLDNRAFLLGLRHALKDTLAPAYSFSPARK